jgi:1-acyl-sn-glycerol-3-phosphate acyltransferase
MAIFRTVFWWISFWGVMFLTLPLFVPLILFKILKLEKISRRYVFLISKIWSRWVVFLTGSRVEITGASNIPNDNRYCVVANHQGSFDIPVIMSIIPSNLGFIAKKELKYLPVFGWWMSAIGVIFLDRSNRRQALKTIEAGAKKVAEGYPMVIFPEGTRSKGGAVAEFKKGSLKLALKSQTKILPISIDGTYKALEANGFLIKPALIKIRVHPVIELKNITDIDRDMLAQKLQTTISSCVNKETE